jgi:subtilisin family serine protease/subtilisin-like proprotein convertase family protein
MANTPHTKTYLHVEQLEARENPSATITGVAADHVLVTFDSLTSEATRAAELRTPQFTDSITSLGFDMYRVDLDPGTDLQKAITYYSGQPGVTMAGADEQISMEQTPNDPGVSQQWALSAISAASAWGVTTGTGTTIVAVIDTGIDYTHPDLAANMWVNPDKTAPDKYGYDFANNDNDPMDDNGHGTHVAGIIGATGNNGIGVTGIDQHVKLMALKFMDANGNGYTSDAIRAIDYAISHGAKILNNSWGGNLPDAYLQAAIARAQTAGVIFVVAAGNESANDDTTISYPTEYGKTLNNVIAVAATDQNNSLASFSNYGPTSVFIGAPGNSIYSTLPGGGYGIKSGTSMATPMISGALALLWDLHPTWTYTQIINKLKTSVDVEPSLQGKVVSGGMLDLAKLLDAKTTVPPTVPVVPPTTPPVSPPPVTSPPPAASPPPSSSMPTTDTLRWTGAGAKIVSDVFSGSTASNLNTVRVVFDKRINVATFTPSTVTLTGPNGNAIAISAVTAVANGSNAVFDITFATQTAAGTYTLKVGPNIWDVTAQRMDQNGNGIDNEAGDAFNATTTLGGAAAPVTPSPPPAVPPTTPAPGSRTTYAAPGLPIAIADLRTTRIEFNVTGNMTVADLKIALNLTHARLTDLNIRLRAPDNTLITLYNRQGTSLTNVTFDSTTTPALSSLNGKLAKGVWAIEIFDLVAGATGTVLSASISFANSSSAAVPAATTTAWDAVPLNDAIQTQFSWAIDLFRNDKDKTGVS